MLTRFCWRIVVKAHVGRWSEDCPEHSGCVVYSMADVPLGFGVVSRFLGFVSRTEAIADVGGFRLRGVRPRRGVSTQRASCASGKQIAGNTSAMRTRSLLVNGALSAGVRSDKTIPMDGRRAF